jgi:DNA-binding PadR family transcriptional regulator
MFSAIYKEQTIMSAKLIILGLLRKSPMHGYEIKQRIEHETMAEWAGVSYGAIYSALNKLARDGFVEKVGTEQVGKRPSRDVYQITGNGHDEFLRLLREALSLPEHRVSSIDIGIRFMDALPHAEARTLLRQHKETLEEVLAHHIEERAHIIDQYEHSSYLEGICVLFDHGILHVRAEIEWLDQVLDKLERGPLS